MVKLLIVEDERAIADSLGEALRTSYVVDVAGTGKRALQLVGASEYDAIILDLKLPDMSGADVCRALRDDDKTMPILILTARGEITSKVASLDAGADDYMTKPFHLDELTARLRSLLRRTPDIYKGAVLRVADLTLDPARRTVSRAATLIPLRRKEFDLLEYLVNNPERVLSRDQIFNHVWDDAADMFTNTIDVHIKYLRDKIDRPFSSSLIKTVHGVGYKIES